MISCIMVTQPGRETQIAASMQCFSAQHYADRELVVIHDGSADLHQYIILQAEKHAPDITTVIQQPSGSSLGTLRNIAIEHASYPIVCQWDDDDLYHPERLSKQYECLIQQQADFCFMTDQLHLFSESRFLFWDDWSIECFPGNLIQGTLMGKKAKLGKYPDLSRGEDTELVYQLSKNHKIAQLSNHAWLYVYIYHGSNAWEESHHKAISHFKRQTYAELQHNIEAIQRELQYIPLPFTAVYMPHEQGKYTINLKSDARSD